MARPGTRGTSAWICRGRQRQLPLGASMIRDANVKITIEFDFYAPGQATGATFWDRSPVYLLTRTYDVFEVGVFRLQRDVLVPSEGAAVARHRVECRRRHAVGDVHGFPSRSYIAWIAVKLGRICDSLHALRGVAAGEWMG